MAYPQSCLLRRIFARPTHSCRDRKTYCGCAEGLCIFNCLGALASSNASSFPSALLAFAAARYRSQTANFEASAHQGHPRTMPAYDLRKPGNRPPLLDGILSGIDARSRWRSQRGSHGRSVFPACVSARALIRSAEARSPPSSLPTFRFAVPMPRPFSATPAGRRPLAVGTLLPRRARPDGSRVSARRGSSPIAACQ